MIATSTEFKQRDAERKRAAVVVRNDLTIPPPKDAARRAAAEADDCLWLQTYCPKVFYNPFTDHQKKIIAECGESLRYGTQKCKAAPRGDGKSSIVKYLALKYSLCRQVRFPLIVAATTGKGKKSLNSLKRRLASKEQSALTEDYPLECTVARYINPWPSRARNVTANGGRRVHVEWGPDWFIIPTWEDEEPLGPILMSLGITSDELQGCNVYDMRPDFVMLDDLDSRDSLASKDGVVAEKIVEAVDKTIAGLGGQSRRLGQFMLCTITSRHSAAYKYSDPQVKPSWSGERIAAIIRWPTNRDEWDRYVLLRQAGKATKDEKGCEITPKDPLGREAHAYYLARREVMDDGAVLSNPYNFETDILPDGSQKHVSALQKCFDYIADVNLESFQTEHQNDPPLDPDETKLPLTAFRIQQHCRSGLDRGIVPDDTVAITVGADVKKSGLNHVTIAWNDRAVGSIIDYDFYAFETQGLKASACELLIFEGLQEWWQKRIETPFCESNGSAWEPDLVVIDSGWKDDGWNSQPVYLFADYVGRDLVLPSKGMSTWTPKKNGPRCYSGDNFNIVVLNRGQRLAEVNPDHWKIRVQEGFIQPFGEPGSLGLFRLPRDQWNREPASAHLTFSKHITSEQWGPFGASRTWKFVPAEGAKTQKPNHYLDATALAICGRSMVGVSTIGPVRPVSQIVEAVPIPALETNLMEASNPPSYESSARSW